MEDRQQEVGEKGESHGELRKPQGIILTRMLPELTPNGPVTKSSAVSPLSIQQQVGNQAAIVALGAGPKRHALTIQSP